MGGFETAPTSLRHRAIVALRLPLAESTGRATSLPLSLTLCCPFAPKRPGAIIAQVCLRCRDRGVLVKRLVSGAATLGIQLDRAQIEQFHRYYRELVDWSKRINLTTVTGWEEVQTRHFLDSLSVSVVLPAGLLGSGGRILDLGSGAGFPGLPLGIAFPGLNVTLMDSTAKRTAFLAHVVEMLGLGNVEVRTGRAEALGHDPALRESFDAVLSRAVAHLSVLAELCLPFCRLGGVVVAQKMLGVDDEIRRAHRAIETMGGRLRGVEEITFEGSEGAKGLVVIEKNSPTPAGYPRRPGIPAKRPL